MRSFLRGLLGGAIIIVGFGAILLPIILAACYGFWWLLLYLIEIPLTFGFIGMALDW